MPLQIALMAKSIVRLSSPSQHVTLLRILQYQYQLVNTVYFVLDTLNERTESVGDVVDESVRDPVGRDRDIIFQVLDTASDVLGVGSASEVELIDGQ